MRISEICLRITAVGVENEGGGLGERRRMEAGTLVLMAVEFRCWAGTQEALNFCVFDKFHYEKFDKYR